MALTAAEIVTAFSNSGFDAASLSKFLSQSKLAMDKQALEGKLNNLVADAQKASAAVEEQRQTLQAAILSKQSEIDQFAGK